MTALQNLLSSLKTARRYAAGSIQVFLRDVGHGLLEVSHNTLALVGLVILHWTLVLTVGIGCVIVMLMKGPAYVADPYALPDSERPAVSAGPSGAAGSLSGR